MKPKIMVSLLVALWLILPGSAEARPVHFFDCKDCHTSSLDLYSLGNTNLCLKCHKDSPPAVTYNDLTTGHKPNGLFHPNEASDALGSATAVGMSPTLQTSHFWASKKDNMPAAGALPPSKTLYTSRYGISTGKVTCTRCHDPHLPITTDPKLLRMSEAGDLICFDCHRPWKLSNNQGRETHPIVVDYAAVATAQPTRYKSSVANVDQGGVQLVSGGVTCTSCHGTHFADSHSASPDGRNNRAGLLAGDGKLLRSDGPKRTGATAAATAQLRSNLCQACHTYKTHGDVNPIGCLDCHSGHVYNNGDPNFFVLRGSIDSVYVPKNSATGAVANLQFKSATAEWMNAGGTGYCQSCHTLPAPHNGLSSGNAAPTSCGECHNHGHANRSFTASCADCHGTPPSAAVAGPAVNGYAKSGSHDYATSGVYKDETLTPHNSHAGGADYRFACDVCHLGKSHATGSFQDVFITPHALASGSGATAPIYNGAGSGSCSAVYCHSNGGARGAALVAAPGAEWGNGAWANGKDVISGKIPSARCKSCHGNDSASMTARSNSASHQKHLAKGYGCNVCHQGTAASASALAAGAIGTTHVNGASDVSYDTSYELSVGRPLGTGSYASGSGSCSIYCHSNGLGTMASPDWDVAASGACGTCHGVTSATLTSGSHAAHLNASGANLSCDSCHGSGAVSGSHSGHVNGTIDRLTQVASCNACHGVDGAEVVPVWGNVASADCGSCHAGSATTSYTDRSAVVRTASAKSAYGSAGHGKTGVAQGCTACHSTATDAAHMGAGSTTRLKTVNGQAYAAATPTAFCGACHDGGSGDETNHYATTGASIEGSKCNICHDPHGVSGYDAMVRSSIGGRSVATFADKTARASYAKASFDGVCQVCHVAADVRRFNQASNQTSHGGSQVCTDCHVHSAGVAFEPRCSGCHGGGTTGSTSGGKNFWPDGSSAHAANQAGEHPVHLQLLIAKAGYASVDVFLNTASSAQQKALCEYCHAADKNDDDHMNTGSAEVFVTTYNSVSTRYAKRIWDGGADGDAAYAAGSCSAVDCHNGKTTPAGYRWYDGGSSACIMCHNGTTGASGIPTSGSHGPHLDKSGFNVYYSLNRIGCPDCHSNTLAAAWTGSTAPSANHIDGVRNVGGSRSLTFSAGSCGTNSCHNNGKNLAAAEAVTWGVANSNGCTSCHTHSAEGHAPHFDAAFNQTHMSSGAMGGFTCTPCHPTYNVGSNHFNGTVSFNTGINYGGGAVVGDASWGSCNTTTCHQTGKGVAVVTPVWNRTPQTTDNCTLCHAGLPTTGSHAKHTVTAATTYGVTGNATTSTQYNFRCGECHGASIGNHINGSPSFAAVGFNSGVKTCSASYCHSDGNGSFTPSPAWGTTPAGDNCAICHGNSPTTNAHQAHVIGFHSKEIYSGLTGFLPVKDADPRDAGLTGSIDQLRGHGGNVAGNGTASTSSTLNCHLCHQDTVIAPYNAKAAECVVCHVANPSPSDADKWAGNAAAEITDKTKHVNGIKEVRFIAQKIRSKAQIRDNLAAVPELGNNWVRVNGYKGANGLSYDETTSTLDVMTNFNSTDKTCTTACHLWEAGRVDKVPVQWTGGSIMCIDCHTRLPK